MKLLQLEKELIRYCIENTIKDTLKEKETLELLDDKELNLKYEMIVNTLEELIEKIMEI